MTSSRSHRGGIRRLTLVAWVGVLLVLALTLFSTFSSASPIHENKQRHAVKSSTADLQILPHEQPPSPSSMPEGVNNGDKSKQLQSLATNPNDLDGKVQLLASGSSPNDIASVVDTSTITTGSEEENVLVRAQNEASDYFNENFNRINVPLTWQRCIGGGILMAIGLYMTLFGFRFPRFTLLLTGFIGGVIACYAILVNVEPAEKWANRVLVYCAVCIAGGLLIGLVLIALNRWALWLLGGAGGLALGVFILSWRNGTLLHNGAARVGMMVGCAGLGALLGLVLGKYIIVFATVLIGGYMFTLGLDMFLRTGFIENYRNMFRHTDAVNYTLNGGIYGMLGVVSLMYLLGALIQLPLFIRHWRNKRRLARAAAASRSDGYGAAPYNRGSQYGGSQYGGSQYGNSRDNLLGPNSGAGTGEKREYNWWGKRINKNSAPGAAPAGMHGPNQSYYSEKSGGRNVATTQASHVNPATTAATTTAGGDKAVVFEEKKDWLGRSKVVPKVVAAGAVGAAGAKAASTVPEASTSTSVQQGSALPTVVYKEKKARRWF
ncbi:hypothetical protein BGW42_008521 [Actinomortierella wolfii]|nr:hypothetical protein BGW42_008521 [Actinomortierella wolfii]